MRAQFKVEWIDGEREPQCAPNPEYPEGIDVNGGISPACKADVPYPAKRCGLYLVECKKCGSRIALTTAGRPDDPRSVMVPCQQSEGVVN